MATAKQKNQAEINKRTKYTTGTKWVDYVTKKYGWLVSIYNSNPEVAEIIRNAYVYDQPVEEVQTKLFNSKWYLGLQSGEYEYLKGTAQNDRAYLDRVAAKTQDVRTVIGKTGYSLNDDQVNLLAAGALKGGWDTNQLMAEINKRVAATAQAGGAVMPTAPTAATPTGLQKGTDAASIRTKAMQYGLKFSDSAIEGYVNAVLNGTMTDDQLTSSFREQAKSLYPSLSKQLDAGTLNDATASYRSIAAATLGIDESSVDFADSTKFGKLLTYKDPTSGEARLMNSTEWQQYLRSLPDWQNTKEAKRGYSDVINTLDKIFGKAR